MSNSGRRGEPFFLVMTLAFLGVVVGGFSSSFYFRGEAQGALPTGVVLHGVILTLWYVVAVAQSALIGLGTGADSIRRHRRIGMATSVIAAGVVWTGVAVAVGFYRRDSGDIVVPAPALLFGNLVSVLGFAACFVAGVKLRATPAAHKRLMTWASLVIIGPASFRLVRDLGLSPIASVPAQFVFVLLLFGYDRLRSRRIHRVSWIGLAILMLQIGGSFTIGKSRAWTALAEALFAAS